MPTTTRSQSRVIGRSWYGIPVERSRHEALPLAGRDEVPRHDIPDDPGHEGVPTRLGDEPPLPLQLVECGKERFDVQPGGSRQRTADIVAQLTENTFTPEKRAKLLIPADDILLSVVQGLSNGGSMAGDRTLASIHPDFADELFAQRLGVQVGAARTAVNLPGKSAQVTVPDPGVFRVDQDLTKGQVDAELASLHDRPVVWTKKPSDLQLVVRVVFTKAYLDPIAEEFLHAGGVELVKY